MSVCVCGGGKTDVDKVTGFGRRLGGGGGRGGLMPCPEGSSPTCGERRPRVRGESGT